MMEKLREEPGAPAMKLYEDKREEKLVWEVRESGLGASAFVPGKKWSWEGWEDSAVDPARIGRYLNDLRGLMDRYGYSSAVYGHFGHGCVHMRFDFDLVTAPGIEKYRAFIHEAAHLCVAYGGSLSGEHGDGQSRAELLPIMFGNDLIAAFQEFKTIWDPDGMMNPGKVVKAYRADENLRLGAGYKPWKPETHFHFADEEGKFSTAVLRCVGVGKCRRDVGGIMCPTYRVTREETHSTRGRAHLLWEMVKGDIIHDGWQNEAVHDALESCIACKGCKADCPVNVDVATYKAEFLSHYHEHKLRPRHAYAFGYVDVMAALASRIPGLANLATQTPRNLRR
jgi:NAD-dependent dihydropyrimidine dehydrogenase PreA subunit